MTTRQYRISNLTQFTSLVPQRASGRNYVKQYTFCAPVQCPTPGVRPLKDPCDTCDSELDSCVGQTLWENDCCSKCGQIGGGCGCSPCSNATVVTSCPPGTTPKLPEELFIARSPMFSDVFSCFETESILLLFETFKCYKLCGCNGAQSLVLATAHFINLFGIFQTNVNGSLYVQASKGRSIESIVIPEVVSTLRDYKTHWNMTAYGLAYKELDRIMMYQSSLSVCL